jgi:Ca2+/Na+ antiporter
LLLEFSLAFGVPVLFLFYGIVFGPFTLFAGIVMGDYLGSLAILVAIVGGWLGLWAAMQLLFLQVYPGVRVAPASRLIVRVLAGMVAIAIFSPLLGELPWFIGVAMILPIPAIVHLAYLNRTYLFGKPAHGA